MSIPNLETTLKQLRLSGLAGTVSLRLQEAAARRERSRSGTPNRIGVVE